jgi:hypothetical protein
MGAWYFESSRTLQAIRRSYEREQNFEGAGGLTNDRLSRIESLTLDFFPNSGKLAQQFRRNVAQRLVSRKITTDRARGSTGLYQDRGEPFHLVADDIRSLTKLSDYPLKYVWRHHLWYRVR